MFHQWDARRLRRLAGLAGLAAVMAMSVMSPALCGDAASPSAAKPAPVGEALSEQARKFKEMISEAVRRHPAVSSANSMRLQREQDADLAYSALLPQVDGGSTIINHRANPPVVAGLPDQRVDASLNATQLVYDFGATFNRVDAAQGQVKAAELQTEGLINSYVLKAVQAYLDVIRYRDLKRAQASNVDKVREMVSSLRERADAGVGSEADVLRGESRLSESNLTLSTYDGKLLRAIATFQEVFDQSPAKDLALPHLDLQQVDLTPEDEQVSQALTRNPAMRRQKVVTEALSHEADAAEEDLLPKLQLEFAGTKYSVVGAGSGGAYNYDVTLQMRVIYKLYTGGADTARTRATVEKYTQQKYDEESATRELGRDVRMALADLKTNEQRIASLQIGARAGQAALEAYIEQFKAGRAKFLELLDAERAASSAKLNLADAVVDVELGKYTVMGLTGDLLPFFDFDQASGERAVVR